jgi:AraC-like DNA-binding protein
MYMNQPDTTAWFRFDGADMDGILEIGRRDERSAKINYLSAHRHDAQRLEICLVAKGEGSETVDGRTVNARIGDVFLVFPGEIHGGGETPTARGMHYFLCLRVPPSPDTFMGFRGQAARNLSAALLGLRPHLFKGSPNLPGLLDNAINCARSLTTDPLAAVRLRHHILGFLLEVIACAGQSRAATRPSLARLLATLDARLEDPPPVAEMARRVGVGVSRFHTLFRQETGCTPMGYVMRRRIDAAKSRLLSDNGASIVRVALALSFSSSQHFATAFRKHVGMTPSAFVRLHSPQPERFS